MISADRSLQFSQTYIVSSFMKIEIDKSRYAHNPLLVEVYLFHVELFEILGVIKIEELHMQKGI